MNCFTKYYYNDHLRQKTQCIQVMRRALFISEFEKICIENEVKLEINRIKNSSFRQKIFLNQCGQYTQDTKIYSTKSWM